MSRRDRGFVFRTNLQARVILLAMSALLASCGSGSSSQSPAKPLADTTPPTAPGGLTTAVVSSTQINLSWTASTDDAGAAGYRLERCQGALCTNFAQIAAPASTMWNDSGLSAATTYSYRVRAADTAGNLSAYSSVATALTTALPDTTPPTTPSGLTSSAASSTQINLSWTASTDNAGVTGYLVERCQGAGCTNFAQIAAPTSTTWSDGGLTGATSYSYRVRAADAAGNLSGYSAVITTLTPALPDTTPPTTPSGLTSSAASSTQINLSWTAATDNAGVTGYLVERCQGAACTNFAQISTTTATTLSDSGLTGAMSYSYRVRATDAAGNLSGYSGIASATTPVPPDTIPPTVPTNLSSSVVSSTRVNLFWTASTDNVGVNAYLVERCQGAGCTNFAQIAAPSATTWGDSGLTPATAYSYRVRATDAAGNLSAYSTSVSATTMNPAAVSVTPVRGGLTVSQTLTLTATVANDVGAAGVTWSASAGSFSAKTTTTATYVAPGTARQITITATSVADGTKSATAVLGVTDLSLMGTYHNDVSRDGANTHEFALTTANVNTASFGKLFSCTVDGAIYAQPLWVSNLTVNGAQHNVIIVATQHDSVYAFDADAAPCVTLWQVSLLDAAHGATPNETSVPSGTANTLVGSGFGDIKPEVGVTGTPVIDPVSKTVYLVSKSAVANALPIYQRLHGLSLLDGSESFGGPYNIGTANTGGSVSAISVPGTADGSTQDVFNAQSEAQRPGLALVNGVVYVAWASHEDTDPYHGWVVGFNASALQSSNNVPTAILNTTPNQVGIATYSRGGIWMSGGAPAVDAGNNLYFSTGNGTFDAASGGSNYGDSTLKLSTSAGLAVADWFTPAEQNYLDSGDQDHGSGGASLLLNVGTGNYLIAGGKEGTLFVLSQNSLGHFGGSVTPANSNVQQEFNIGGYGIFSTAAFWNNSLFIAGAGSGLQNYTFDTATGLFNTGAASIGGHTFGWPGASPSISASGSSNGIAWALDTNPYCTTQSTSCGSAVLYAMDATHLSTELWDSSLVAADAAGNAVKFTVPTVANGKVYVGTRGNDTGSGTASVLGELDVYGLKAN
jgi:chitodextrinase